MIGRLIDGRYQVRSRIARGGMATVYLATDLRLERRVAMKVMHHHLADDVAFKQRFIQEARSAARLSHPNVVGVFDQGQELDMAYLVMEYLPGITLRELLKEHKVLTPEQSLDILEAVLSGLAAAHKAGIVHRDLKPENVLLADDGRIKIGDFGLARAATANTATGAALLGTIAYLSPELVTRGIADTRSDIYAVGIMLYEMLTGEQPFKGDQPMQIAYQHANDTVPTPSTANPSVPAELDELVQWATAREPDERPRDARVMLDQLFEVQRVLHGHSGPQPSLNRTAVLPAALRSGAEAATQVLRPAPVEKRKQKKEKPARDAAATSPVAALTAVASNRRRRGAWIAGLLVLLTALAAGTGWYFGPGPGGQVTVPSLVSATPDDARAELEALGLAVADETQPETSPEIDEGLVLRTTPDAGESLVRGTEVTLVVSSGPAEVPTLDVTNLPQDQAVQQLTDANFVVAENVARQFSWDVPEGTVMGAYRDEALTDPLTSSGTWFEQSTVYLDVSAGSLPYTIGDDPEDVIPRLQELGLTVDPEYEYWYSDSVAEGAMVNYRYDDPLRPGGTIKLIVSLGPELVEVPNVRGMVITEAVSTLEAAGFSVTVNSDIPRSGWGFIPVTGSNPGAGQEVKKGSTITITGSV
ncbi:Stk1 family PASTA domain-containing Ser/Thr kinase [Desertivibrio insolitus]|uniref:Stk1 family PASTA domain-containing Ser/Thr kinase n=1 Tax=Herbiconiux sp. SYSU D00978 TaxID=2812562 RepID=UPI001A9722A7